MNRSRYILAEQQRHLFHGGHVSPPVWMDLSMLPPWAIGMVQTSGWRSLLRWPARPYEIDLGTQQGVMFGVTESGLSTSMHRLAFNAARSGWKVFFFDAQGSHHEASMFYEAMQLAGCQHVHLFPHDAYDGWRGTGSALLHRLLQVSPFREPYYKHIATVGLATVLFSPGSPPRSLDELVDRLNRVFQKRPMRRGLEDGRPFNLFEAIRTTDLPGTPLRFQALSSLVGNSLNGSWSFDQADAAYFSLSAWNRPEEARLQARFLLADLASYLVERVEKETHVLLLIKHPEQLFDMEQVTSLFAQMQRAHGSLFVAARSTSDFGRHAPHLLKNASTILVHRSLTSLPFEPYLARSWQKPHLFLNGALQRLPDHGCFVIAEGCIDQVQVTPVPTDPAAVASTTRSLFSPSKIPESFRSGDVDPSLSPFLFDVEPKKVSALEVKLEELFKSDDAEEGHNAKEDHPVSLKGEQVPSKHLRSRRTNHRRAVKHEKIVPPEAT